MPVAAVVLAGGASRRMGRDKLSLPRDGKTHSADTTVLSHVVTVVAALADLVYVVTAPAPSPAPEFSRAQRSGVPVLMETDGAIYRGPLHALNGIWGRLVEYDAVYVVAGDLPGVTPRVLTTCKSRLDVLGPDYDGVAVLREGRWQPLLACYRPIAGRAWCLAETGETRILRTFAMLRMGAVDDQLQGWPAWWTRPIHTPEDYTAWLDWQRTAEIQTDRGGPQFET